MNEKFLERLEAKLTKNSRMTQKVVNNRKASDILILPAESSSVYENSIRTHERLEIFTISKAYTHNQQAFQSRSFVFVWSEFTVKHL